MQTPDFEQDSTTLLHAGYFDNDNKYSIHIE